MTQKLQIYTDRLRAEESLDINESLPPAFMDISEEDIQFRHPVEIEGTAYLAEDHLVVDLKVSTSVTLPCGICNVAIDVPIEIEQCYLTQDLSELRSGIYDYTDSLREAILLETPAFAECEGECPERNFIKQYLNQSKPQTKDDTPVYFPFGDLDNPSTK